MKYLAGIFYIAGSVCFIIGTLITMFQTPKL